jgi:hypothetical protein
MLDFSKLAPMTKRLLLQRLQDITYDNLASFNEDISDWEKDGSIKSKAGQELIGWRDALIEFLREVVKEQKDAK